MVRTRLTSSGLSTGGSLSGSLMCPTSAARSWRRSVTRNRNRHPDHDPIAVADARPALDQVQLELAHLVGRCRIGRAFEPSGEPLATGNVATLGVRGELACSHIFDHTLTQRTNGVGLAHGELHSELRLTAPRYSAWGSPALSLSSQPATALSALAPAQRAGAQRLCALAHRDILQRRAVVVAIGSNRT